MIKISKMQPALKKGSGAIDGCNKTYFETFLARSLKISRGENKKLKIDYKHQCN
jgi:hypothetical protein